MASLSSYNDLERSRSRGLSFEEVWNSGAPDVFNVSRHSQNDAEENLMWAAIERLPTYDRMRKGVLKQMHDDGNIVHNEIDIVNLKFQDKKVIMDKILHLVEQDNEKFLSKLRDRIDRVGITLPKIEVRYEDLYVEGDVHVGGRALPTLLNVLLNILEVIAGVLHLIKSKKKEIQILKNVSGIVKPSRITLLLGPPASGKSTLLLALAGKLDKDLRTSGKITYCGHELNEFVPQKTSAYISQQDLHIGQMTVKETLDFSGRCLGVGSRYDMLAELTRREKQEGIKPDPEIDAFMKALAMSGQETSLSTDYILKILGLDICADIMVGDNMNRGISGGQKKRVTTGEMLVGPAKALFMDEISTGLDSSTTFQICKVMRQMVHIMDITMVISLLQPAPETYELFDDIILLSEGQTVYQGPRENVLEFFEHMGFKCPARKGVADFLQEVTSKKDQQQYWNRENEPYRYVTVPEFVNAFSSFKIGEQIRNELKVPYEKEQTHPAALVKDKYGISNRELLQACFTREVLLMKRGSFVYIFKTIQITIMSIVALTVFLRTQNHPGTFDGGQKYMGGLFFAVTNLMFNGMSEQATIIQRLPIFYKQRELLFFPPWAFALPIWVLRIPLSLMDSGIWIIFTYYTIGYAPSAGRFFRHLLVLFCIHQMAVSLFRCIAAISRTQVVANIISFLVFQVMFVLGGFIISKDAIKKWLIWGYYMSPMMYGQNAIVINEFLDDRWSQPNTDQRIHATTIGKAILKSRGFYTQGYWYWIGIGALLGFAVLFNLIFIVALTYLSPFGDSKSSIITDEDEEKKKKNEKPSTRKKDTRGKSEINGSSNQEPRTGMTLPFQPLSLTFNHVNYYVDMPAEMKKQGIPDDRLQLLKDVSGAFRPGILTALMGVSGAGKTTLMDVLAGRKTGGYIEGSITISGYPKNQETFARISGYCEQNDIHSPNVTVYESLLFSAWLRLSADVNTQERKMFVDEVMELLELKPIGDTLVGLPGTGGLSTEQRKRLTIAVELVANPSIIFMDEPTSGLDARAAAIVMRTVRNTVNTGRTVVCTIHQPSIDIFESFDELVLMKRGGQISYAGPIGHQSQKLIEYFEGIAGVEKITDGYNPATWMLEVSTPLIESQLDVDFAQLYTNSTQYQRNQELIKELSTPPPDSKDLFFESVYAQSFYVQWKACFWKLHWSYWRNPQYNFTRYSLTIIMGLIFGAVFWNKGKMISEQQDLLNMFGGLYVAVVFLGFMNASAVQPIVDIERTVLYREKAAGMYSAFPYAISQVAIEGIYIIIQTVVYSLILYSMIGLKWRADKFFWFYYYITTCFLYYTLYGMMAVALTPGYQVAAISMSFFMTLWNLFAGFTIPMTQIPIWWRWFYWICPVPWTFNGIITSQYGDLESEIIIPGSANMGFKAFLKDRFGFHHDFLPVIAVVHISWSFLFLLGFAFGIKFLNFQKR
ncbi:PREDICTED: ABC transporter G family member 39-like [Lupinus angustifolius]|uniref:ABC transporter G family member 39-like n=1 Tax=Lupinus angustifolius TaxID=3871 RepID=UPI00092E8293|nr:PREDICTED: ABC transporter G family member 39-like [Lupinus angustifolius]